MEMKFILLSKKDGWLLGWYILWETRKFSV